MLTEADSPIIGLSEEFEAYRLQLISMGVLPPEAGQAYFAWHCCQRDVCLPQKKLESMPIHIAGYNPGTLRHGWFSDIPMIYVAPNPPSGVSVQALQDVEVGGCVIKELQNAGFFLQDIFLTYAIRFALCEGRTSFLESHKRNCGALLRADLLGVKPRVAVLSGSDALKALFGRDAKLDNYLGVIHEWQGIPVIPTISHLQLAHGHASMGLFQSCLDRARDFLVSGKTTVEVPQQRDYRICLTAREIETTCHELVAKADTGALDLIVFDTEFGNDVAQESETYTRSVQVAWEAGCVAYFGLHGPQGETLMSAPDMARSVDAMKRLFEHPRLALGGHHLRVDVQRLSELGIDVDEKLATGYDTMLLHHLLFGDDDQGLEVLIRKACPEFGNYWKPLEDWLADNGKAHHLQFGYATIPDDILIPYSMKDADATFSALHWLLRQFRRGKEHLLRIYFDITAPTSLHLLDVERQGVLIDDEYRQNMRAFYEPVYEDLLARLRSKLNWPGFNPGSKDQVLMLLFNGVDYRDKKPHIVPPGAKILEGLIPLFNTDKYPKDWPELRAEGVERFHTPSTKSEALEILYGDTKIEEIKLLRQVLLLRKMLRDYLSPIEYNEFGFPVDGKGIHNNIWSDGRVRTHLWQTSETHRYRSSKPNLQTSPKRQEAAARAVFIDYYFGLTVDEYEQRCSDEAKGTPLWIPPERRIQIPAFKSCMVAPEDYYLIEADFATAELAVLAFASQDPVLIAIVDQNRDLHSEMACKAFKMTEWETKLFDALAALDQGDPGPYKKWNKGFKGAHGSLRIAAKTVNFG